ncbi:hypothetical protein NEFER03_1487 [Nematocida sp. LUAm3]|nr:hypothetical protein NEFER03_1487 [Nematocida sp. LUAm3]KAI5174520.1 hypothetical protein NEFER02_0641 [Nematocida sp. LUAm2]KAI5178074.1 hypothetical protein NEFER01_1256 [Nematocida sp. LUAm1]
MSHSKNSTSFYWKYTNNKAMAGIMIALILLSLVNATENEQSHPNGSSLEKEIIVEGLPIEGEIVVGNPSVEEDEIVYNIPVDREEIVANPSVEEGKILYSISIEGERIAGSTSVDEEIIVDSLFLNGDEMFNNISVDGEVTANGIFLGEEEIVNNAPVDEGVIVDNYPIRKKESPLEEMKAILNRKKGICRSRVEFYEEVMESQIRAYY